MSKQKFDDLIGKSDTLRVPLTRPIMMLKKLIILPRRPNIIADSVLLYMWDVQIQRAWPGHRWKFMKPEIILIYISNNLGRWK